jgi:NADPH2:quinone reductase
MSFDPSTAARGSAGPATYRATVLTRRGGPEVLEVRELPLPEPGPGEARVRVTASGVGATDVSMRRGSYRFAPPIPFVPGYEVVGVVEKLGPGARGLAVGQRVAALTVHGGYGEVVVRRVEELVPVPAGLDDGEVAALILNYVTAYQMIERVARPEPGQTALVTGANGGVGTALLELLRARGVRAIGAAQPSRHELVQGYGATPIPSRGAPLDVLVRGIAPLGVDVAFDGIGGSATAECVRATRRGGRVVGYGFVGTLRAGRARASLFWRGIGSLLVGSRLTGRKGSIYGITLLYRRDPRPFREDLPRLLELLARRRIAPRIAARLPLLEARRANELLEAGGLEGKIVLVADATAPERAVR